MDDVVHDHWKRMYTQYFKELLKQLKSDKIGKICFKKLENDG